MQINLGRNKTEVMHYNTPSPNAISYRGQIIPITESYTYLGYEIGPSPDAHIDYRQSKLNSWLKKVENRLAGTHVDYVQRVDIMKTYIRPKLTYCVELCTPSLKKRKKLEVLERKFFYKGRNNTAFLHRFTVHSPKYSGWNFPELAHHQTLKLARYILSLNRFRAESRQVRVMKTLLFDEDSWFFRVLNYWKSVDKEFTILHFMEYNTPEVTSELGEYDPEKPRHFALKTIMVHPVISRIITDSHPDAEPRSHQEPESIYYNCLANSLDNIWSTLRLQVTNRRKTEHHEDTRSLSFMVINRFCENAESQLYRKSPNISAGLVNFITHFRNLRLPSEEVIYRIFKKIHLATPICSLCNQEVDYNFHFIFCSKMYEYGRNLCLSLLNHWESTFPLQELNVPFFPIIITNTYCKRNQNLCDDELYSIAAAASGAFIGEARYIKLGLPFNPKYFKNRVIPKVTRLTRMLWIEFQRRRHEIDPNLPSVSELDRILLTNFLDGNNRPVPHRYSQPHIFSQQNVVGKFTNYLVNSRRSCQ